jgi:mannose-6-phosphate isomerase
MISKGPADHLRLWLTDTSLPLWLAHGVDHQAGGFHESLSPDFYICDAPFRRLRVAARQTYVFARAHAAGVQGAGAAAALGVEFLLRRAALPDGGYATRLDLAGRATDTSLDLYDHAFVLLAFAAATAVLPPDPLRLAALNLLEFIGRAFAHSRGGYLESLPPSLPRRQNPHMHLLEAALAAHRAFGDPIFLDTVRSLVGLCLDRFVHPTSGALLEFFSDDLQPHPAPGLHPVEPGHCCEWAWLLQTYQAAAGPDPAAARAASGLVAFAEHHGIHPATGDLVDTVTPAGTALSLASRLWPQTERLKAAAACGDGNAQARAAARLETWLRPDGLWTERRDDAGVPIHAAVPASSLYHLTCALLPEPPLPR